MKWIGTLAAAVMMAWGVATSAAAERVSLRCSQSLSESYADYRGAIENETTVERDIVLEFDTDTGEFSIGATRGRFTLDTEAFIGISHRDHYYAAWDIDRRTGRMLVMGLADVSDAEGVNWALMRREGTCVGPSGTPGF